MSKPSTFTALGLCLAAAVFSCGMASAQATLPPQGEPKPAGFRIVLDQVPADTPQGASIYIAGSFNGWETNQPQYRLSADGNGHYAITLPSSIRGPIEFKFTLGSRRTFEVDAAGAEIANRRLTVAETGPATYSASILAWPALHTPEGWQKAAAMDLAAIHDLLRDNAPQMYVDRDSAEFRKWLEAGYAKAQRLVPTVQDYNGYVYLLWEYAGGFRDSHLRVSGSPEHHTWPGIAMGWADGAYVVRQPPPMQNVPMPPVGAKLLDCDGRSAEEIARSRLDRFTGNLDLATGRIVSAVSLLADLGNPYVARLKTCRFQEPSGIRQYPLSYRLIDRSALKLRNPARARFGLEQDKTDPKIWRIGIPAMSSELDWPQLYAAIEAHRTEIQSSDRILIDLRGNGGGNSEFAWQVATRLWGSSLVEHYRPFLGPIVYPVTPALRQELADTLLPRLRKQNSDGKISQDTVAEYEKLLAELDKAKSEGRKTITVGKEAAPARGEPPANPVKAQIFLVTDPVCNSACLDLMDLFLAMPNVYQVGTETNADTIFMEVETHKLPSGLEYLLYGHKAWIKRPRGSNVPYKPTPALTYHGDLADQTAFERWLAGIPAQKSP